MCTLPVQLTPLIGREREVADVVTLLSGNPRILTLTGPGGTGKTRLGLQAAAELGHRFEHGVRFVNLAAVNDIEQVAPAIAMSLGLKEVVGEPPLETVKSGLRDKRMLLMVDNFEQVSAAGPQVGQLASAAPGVKVLVTSRVPLGIHGEYECPVPPLAADEAVRLFVERARAINPHFQPSEEVAQICARLDCLPLAVELAAARTRLLTPKAMLSRLRNRLDLLIGGAHDAVARQRTLRETIDWSYQLLGPSEQRLFARLAVFSGGCALDAAEALCGDQLDELESLVHNNLIRHEQGRFVMLETIHEFAREKLGDASAPRHAHATYYTELAECAKPDPWTRSNLPESFEVLTAEHGNFHAALDWTLRDDVALGRRLVAALWRFWFMRGHWHEGAEWLRRALPHGGGEIYYGASAFASSRGDHATAREHLAHAVAGYEQEGDPERAALALGQLGDLAYAEGDRETARQLLEQALDRSRGVGAGVTTAFLLGSLAEVLRADGDLTGARELNEESLATSAKLDGVAATDVNVRCNLGNVVHREGDCERALELFTEAITTAAELGFAQQVAMCLFGFAGVAATLGAPRRAARLFGAGERIIDELEATLWPADRDDYERGLAVTREQLSAKEFEALRQEGSAMSLTEAIDHALGR